MPTVKDVAELAGVSVATVSRTLANQPHVSDAARERVLQAVAELGYRPDEVARSLRLRRTNLIGLCVSTIETVFFTEIARAAERTAHEHNYNLIVCNTEEDPEQEKKYLDVLHRQLVAGVILAPAPGEAMHLDTYVKKGLSIVLINRRIDRLACSSVTSNDEEVSYETVSQLIQQGRKRIAAITGFPDASTTQDRLRGYRRALHDAGMPYDDELVICGWSNLKGGYQAAYDLMNKAVPPDALFAFNDLMIQGSVMALQDREIPWPDQVDVTGFGAFSIAQLYHPPLMLIDQPTYEMGRKAVEVLIKQVEDDNSDQIERIVLKNQIISREAWRTGRHPDFISPRRNGSVAAVQSHSTRG